ncbi:protein transport protein Sec16B isoform X3 [Ochotona princeps]|uniref:protein transport protein Sec16B isoform X3 n=1 Tax=Ochotona princeps TaxID=9978 RepID=UPI0027152F0A|nr:protein transport protein Sec16B isoform X3 [Ochotona princeps]
MEAWVPQWPPQPQGRPSSPAQEPEGALQRDGLRRSATHSRNNRERLPRWQEVRGSPQPQQDPRLDQQQPHPVSRRGLWQQRGSGADYHGQLYSRPSYEGAYQNYHSPALKGDYAYRSHYYHGHPQWLQEERVPRHGSPFVWHEEYRDQRYLRGHHHENQRSSFGRNDESQFQSTRRNPYQDDLGQDRPNELLPETLLSGTWKNKPSLASKSNLLRQHESGLSSSSYELSQYMVGMSEQYNATAAAGWRPVSAEDVLVAGSKAPKKFHVPHVSVSFGPGGQLVCVSPSSPTDGQTALVELHSMEVLLNDWEEQEEMRMFPGPLTRDHVHKVDIMTFCQQKVTQSRKSETLGSRDSALLWQLLVLLCRQNGSIAGSDIAELLMRDCKKLDKYKRQPPVGNLIKLTDEDHPVLSSGTRNLLTGEIPPSVETHAQIVQKFTKLLYYGRKKEALEWAMKNNLWGHALFLSYKMDPRTYNWVMSGFTSTLALNDPLQTLFQLLSGRIPQAATCCGDTQWGDWRPHLAVILSNQAGDPELRQRVIVTMGDTLAGKGLVEAAHFCYLMAQVPFGHYTVNADRLALLGSSHSQEFLKFATTEAIQRTEIFEYCQTLGRPESFIPAFQVYKLIYASRLADYGLASQALYYCEAIGTAILSQAESSHPVLLEELIKLAERLKLSDPLVLERHRGDGVWEPVWLRQLRRHWELQIAGDAGDPRSTNADVPRAREATEPTLYQDLSGYQGYPKAPGYQLDPWPTAELTDLPQPGPQQPFSLQPGPEAGQAGTPGPETHLPVSVEQPQAPEGRVWEDTLWTHPVPGDVTESTAAPEIFQQLDSLEVVSSPQVPLAPRARTSSETSTRLVKEAEEESSDEADGKSPPDTARKGKPADRKENGKSSGFGWFSWFRSKPTKNASPSGEEDSSDSPDSEQENPRASSPSEAGQDPSLTPPLESPPVPGGGTFSRDKGRAEVRGGLPTPGMANGAGIGDLSGPGGVSSELYSGPGVLLPPPSLEGAVPLYNPSQVPQLPMATGLNRPNRLAQRRYPTQPC